MNEKIDGLNVIKIKNSHLLQIPLRGWKGKPLTDEDIDNMYI